MKAVFVAQVTGLVGGIALLDAAPYVLSSCPTCGHNPTRAAKGGWLGPRAPEAKLRKLTACEACGAEE
jgi:hypothetical protein